MVKLTRYTNFEDLKNHKHLTSSRQSGVVNESEIKRFIELLRNHRFSISYIKTDNSSNQPANDR